MKIEISWKDIRKDLYKSSGPGGQAKNKTESAVRLTHIPTGIRAQSSSDRSQHANLAIAIKLLLSRLLEHFKKLEYERLGQGVRKENVGGGSQTRSYFLDKDRRVVDHETHLEKPPAPVLNGRIDDLLMARMIKRLSENERSL